MVIIMMMIIINTTNNNDNNDNDNIYYTHIFEMISCGLEHVVLRFTLLCTSESCL